MRFYNIKNLNSHFICEEVVSSFLLNCRCFHLILGCVNHLVLPGDSRRSTGREISCARGAVVGHCKNRLFTRNNFIMSPFSPQYLSAKSHRKTSLGVSELKHCCMQSHQSYRSYRTQIAPAVNTLFPSHRVARNRTQIASIMNTKSYQSHRGIRCARAQSHKVPPPYSRT